MASKRLNPYAKRLAQLTKAIAKTKPAKLHRPLFDVFVVVAATGDATRAAKVVDWMYGRTPPPKDVASALSTQAIDGFCAAAGLGDRTKGLPARGEGSPRPPAPSRRAHAETRTFHPAGASAEPLHSKMSIVIFCS